MERLKDLIIITVGVLNLSYIWHLISVCLPEYLKGDGLAYSGGVSVVLECIVGQFIVLGCIVVVISIASWSFCVKNRKGCLRDGKNEI
jgi:hypothetical protein